MSACSRLFFKEIVQFAIALRGQNIIFEKLLSICLNFDTAKTYFKLNLKNFVVQVLLGFKTFFLQIA